MNQRRKVLGVVLIFFLLTGCGMWLWLASREQPSAKLGSGAVITLQKVTYGKEHRFVHGSLWQRVRSRLPEKWFGKSGAVILTHRTTNDAAIAWLVWKGTNVTMMLGFPSYVVVNDRDEKLQCSGQSSGAFLLHRAGQDLIDGRELLLPRRGENARLRLYEFNTNSQWVCAGEFKIPNPSHKESPSWKPEPLPIPRTDGNVEFTLSQFTAGTEVRVDRGLLTAMNKLTFQIAENGQRTTNWQLRSIRASDALGNQNAYGVASHPDRQGNESWEGYWLLWPDEPAWKLRLEFMRRSGFAADEQWLVKGIPVPGRDLFTPKTFQTNLQSVNLLVRGISDAQGLLPDGQMSVNATSNVLDIKWSSAQEGVRVSLLEVTDDRGQKVRVNGSVGGDHGQVGYGLDMARTVHSVNALIAVRRSRVVEFLAKPELISTNSPSTPGKK